jgi:hypothetical protein
MVAGKRSLAKVKIPGIEFRYSWVYNQENRARFTDPLYPSADSIREYIGEVREAWKPKQRSLLSAIARSSGLPWREESIVCYVVGRGVPMSDPLTMPLYENDMELFIEKLVHELIERILMHPRSLEVKRDFWEAMFRAFGSDGVKVSYRVPVNAIYSEIHEKHFKLSQAYSESLVTRNLDYRRAWEIVNELGHKNIIERFREGTWD